MAEIQHPSAWHEPSSHPAWLNPSILPAWRPFLFLSKKTSRPEPAFTASADRRNRSGIIEADERLTGGRRFAVFGMAAFALDLPAIVGRGKGEVPRRLF